jgi:hypothetical protein
VALPHFALFSFFVFRFSRVFAFFRIFRKFGKIKKESKKKKKKKKEPKTRIRNLLFLLLKHNSLNRHKLASLQTPRSLALPALHSTLIQTSPNTPSPPNLDTATARSAPYSAVSHFQGRCFSCVLNRETVFIKPEKAVHSTTYYHTAILLRATVPI